MTQAPGEPTDSPVPTARTRRTRWWPAAVILLLALGTLVWIWEASGRQRQDRNLATIILAVLTSVLLLLWCLFLSRVRWKVRLGIVGGVLGLVCLATALLRFHGVTGDMLPVFRWRWETPSWTSTAAQPKGVSTDLAERGAQFTNDWPQFLGPHRNSEVEQPRLARDWKAQAPQRLWLQPVGPGWCGFAVAGGRAITQEQRGVAYRAATGDFVWGNGTDGAAYSSPCLITLAGIPQILIFNSNGISAHDPVCGTNLWKHPWPSGHPHVSMPIVLPGDRLLVSSGYGTGSELLKLQADTEGKLAATRVWKSNRLKAKFTNVVYRDGYIYGLDDGIMTCLDATSGEQKWKAGRYGHGQEILAGDLLLVGAESGEVILLDPSPEESRELTRFYALKGKTWNPPALAGQYLVVRNDKEAACYRLPVPKR
jgi:hypothetical protein